MSRRKKRGKFKGWHWLTSVASVCDKGIVTSQATRWGF
jgi:hypothetical protein